MCNIGDGNVKGIEFDLLMLLSVISMLNIGVFFNYLWFDLEVDDIFGSCKFND